ncbi:hypothetical protein AB0H88_39095 [Nonomuraea sp. NPDC050680]
MRRCRTPSEVFRLAKAGSPIAPCRLVKANSDEELAKKMAGN